MILRWRARYATKLIWMKSGHIVAAGPTESSLTEENCRDVYGIESSITGDRVTIEGLHIKGTP